MLHHHRVAYGCGYRHKQRGREIILRETDCGSGLTDYALHLVWQHVDGEICPGVASCGFLLRFLTGCTEFLHLADDGIGGNHLFFHRLPPFFFESEGSRIPMALPSINLVRTHSSSWDL